MYCTTFIIMHFLFALSFYSFTKGYSTYFMNFNIKLIYIIKNLLKILLKVCYCIWEKTSISENSFPNEFFIIQVSLCIIAIIIIFFLRSLPTERVPKFDLNHAGNQLLFIYWPLTYHRKALRTFRIFSKHCACLNWDGGTNRKPHQ